jgi:hypothetical protein
VEFEAEQVLRIWADFVHGRVLVANIELVFVRHGGRQFRVLCEVARIVVMAREVLLMVRVSPPSLALGRSETKVT